MIHWLHPDDPPDAFPDPARALREPNGLLAAGGDLSAARLLAAYRRGIFPWYSEDQQILWWSPNPREVLWPAKFHISRSLARRRRRADFEYRHNYDFATVMAECAAPRAVAGGTWIDAAMRSAYLELHRLGHAHSLEIWRQDRLVGGLYGVRVGPVFAGESMFSRETDASKLALAQLAATASDSGIELIDCQMPTAHLRSLGSEAMPRREFLTLLRGAGLH